MLEFIQKKVVKLELANRFLQLSFVLRKGIDVLERYLLADHLFVDNLRQLVNVFNEHFHDLPLDLILRQSLFNHPSVHPLIFFGRISFNEIEELVF